MNFQMRICALVLFLGVLGKAGAQDAVPLHTLQPGKTKMVNALWGENPKERQFINKRRVVIANLKGPGVITMIHFALPYQSVLSQKPRLNRDLLLRIYWDDEKAPSVEAPLVDFFCDPNGALERVDTVLVNKKRGWNCYFEMPFRRSARVELVTDNERVSSAALWNINPCYSYVMYRSCSNLPKNVAYFHAKWRQETLLLGKKDYLVFEAKGKGHFIGWNMTIRGVAPGPEGYPVDENVKFYIDGEKGPSIEWQGLEDSFGFSWGFPPEANSFPYTGWQPFYKGAAAYRFCLSDRISFGKSIKMTVGFGKNEAAWFRETYSKPENRLQLSSVAYWYQTEPHFEFYSMPPASQRLPDLDREQFAEAEARAAEYRKRGEALCINCGLPENEGEYIEKGWDYRFKQGYSFFDEEGKMWKGEIRHCWADYKWLEFDIICPKGASGTLRLFIIDADKFTGGRKQRITVAGRVIGEFDNFEAGRWVEVLITEKDTARGKIPVRVANLKPGANAVVSLIRFISSNQ